MDPPWKFTARRAANASEKSYLDVFYLTHKIRRVGAALVRESGAVI